MKRHRARKKSSIGVALFPFLAVLICTMGVLIVLLLIEVQMARVDASEEANAVPTLELPGQQQIAKEEFEWRRDVLDQQRDQVKEQMARKRLELSHVEEHIRELEQRWRQLQEVAADLQRRMQGEDAGQDASRAELERLQQEVRAAQEALEAARSKVAQRPMSYAIVPYDGPNGTRRRPIYIECTAEGVILRPEGIVLGAKDFDGPLGPGNPLDAALRAMREYYAHAGLLGSQGEPYPLLIVRPGGVEAYAAARTAMRTWDDEFGYELVDETMHLKYPEPDPALSQLLAKVVQDARSRQEILAAAMPSSFPRDREVGFVASPTTGGFVAQRDSGGSAGGSRTGGFGRGGDQRFADGHSTGSVAGAPPPAAALTPAGTTDKGSAEGTPDAKIGTGVSSMAKARGRNWGLPQHTANATGVVRPLRIGCLPDRLILLPDLGESRTPEIVLVDGSMLEEIDALVSKIWSRVDEWGIAVAGGYWKPVLNVYVAQGADGRFEELRVLLDGSGLEVRRIDQ
ncbi:MAG: hypothetical protein ACYC0X_05450 [Pirellulaceae bacterium]